MDMTIQEKKDLINKLIAINTDVDVVVHCAAIVHKKEAKFATLYDKVNYELTVMRSSFCYVKSFDNLN